MPKTPYWYYILALVPPLMAACSYTASKYVIDDISPIALLFYRWFSALVMLTPFALGGFISELKAIRENVGIVTIISASGVTFFNFFIYYSLQYTTSTNTAIVTSVFPVFVLFLGVLIYKDKLQKLQLFSMAIALIGAVVIISHGHILQGIEGLFHNVGDFIALAAALCFAIYFVAVKSKPKNISFYPFVYATFLIGTILILPIYLFDVLYLGNRFDINVQNVSVILFLGFAVSIVGMMLMNMTMLRIGPNLASILFYAAPLFTALISVTVLGEKFEMFHLVGMVFIVVGVNLPVFWNMYLLRRSVLR